MKERPLSDFGLVTQDEAQTILKCTALQLRGWLATDKLTSVPVGSGNNKKRLLIAAEVKAFVRPLGRGQWRRKESAK
jgi:hypothetical protein